MRQFKNIIWDFNGTIIDDAELCLDSYNHVLQQYDKPVINRQQLSDTWSLPVQNFFAQFNFHDLDGQIQKICEVFHDHYSKYWQECSLQPGVADLIRSNHERNTPQAVLSGHPHNYLVEMLDYYQLVPFFTAIKGVDTIVAVDKIHTGHQLLKELAWNPKETLLIGDANFDLETAEALGISCALISRGIQLPDRLAKYEVPVFDNLKALQSAFEI